MKVVDPQLEEAIETVQAMLRKVRDNDDIGAPYEDCVVDALSLIKQVDQPNYQRTISKLKKLGIRIAELEKLLNPSTDPKESESAIEESIRLMMPKIELFHTAQNKAFADLHINNHRETWPIESIEFSEWYMKEHYKETRKILPETALKSIMIHLKGIAKFDGECNAVYLRCANVGDLIVIDLCNDKWQAIIVSKDGYEITDKPPVRFWRSSNMQALPIPKKGKIKKLWEFVSVKNKADQVLIVVLIFAAWCPDLVSPILELLGAAGANKSSSQRFLVQIIDPTDIPLLVNLKSDLDIYNAAHHRYLLSFDNLSQIKNQDLFCSISTGGTFTTRQLFTDLGITSIKLKHPCIINGINELAKNQDLIDRIVRIELSKRDDYLPEPELYKRFEQARPEIIGGLLQLFADTLTVLPEMRDKVYRDRMADFIMLGEAVFKVRGINASFSDLYLNKKREAVISAIDNSPVLTALLSYLRVNSSYKGSYQSLLGILRNPMYSNTINNFPRSARGLAQIIKSNLSALNLIGIDVVFTKRKNSGHNVIITRNK